ncbi:hypothetical protein [Virgibacillus sediminis]|uniref:Uncharacterized protein n=1 Tax=Virgibacillus sediminis TaxID=202260 RepID=A0ABV7A817_9BACI
MDPVIAALIIIAIIALGEVISIQTRAKVPMMLVVVVIVFVLFQVDILPEGIIEASTFTVVGAILQPAIMIHMGTLIPMSVLKKQYKAVIISLIGLLCSILSLILVVPIFFDYPTAVAGAGPLTGGLIAFLVTEEALRTAGLTALIAIPIIVFTIQQVVGMPLSSLLLQKYGIKIRNAMDAGTYVSEEASIEDTLEDNPKKKLLIPEKYSQSSFVLLFLIFVGSALAVWLADITGISYSLFGLAIGIIGAYVGFYPSKVLERANGFSIAMTGLIFIVLGAVVGITWQDILNVLPAAATILIVGTIGLIIGGFIGSKIFKWDPLKGIPVALTAMFGFPADYLISHEVSRSVGRNEEEKEIILTNILSPMLIGGFTSVSIASIVIASILVATL